MANENDIQLDDWFEYAGWDAMDLIDAFMVIEDALDDMGERGYL